MPVSEEVHVPPPRNADVHKGRSREGLRALEESRALYSSVVETAPVGICIHQDDRYVFVNPEAVRIFGAHDASQVIGQSIWDFFAEESKEAIRRIVTSRYETGQEDRVESKIRRLDGTIIDIRSVGRRVTFNGRPALQVVLEDVTSERRAQAALAESEARLRAIVEASTTGTFLKDVDRRIVLANKFLCDLWNVSEPDILGKRPEEFLPPEIAALVRVADSEIMSGSPSYRGEFSVAGSDLGRRFFTDFTFPIRGHGGEFIGIGGVVVETTESKRAEDALRASEATLRAFVEHIPASVCLRNAAGRYILANRTYQAWHGAVDTRTTLRDVFGDDAAQFEAQDEEVKRSGRPLTVEQKLPLRGGASITALITKFPVTDANGEVSMVGAIGTDISARKLFEEDLSAAKHAAEIANRAKTEFLANMSHELRTPLNSVLGFCQIMEQEMFGPLGSAKYREYVADVLKSGRGLLALIDDILDISRVEAGGMPLDQEWIEVGQVMEGAVHLVAATAEARRLAVGIEAGSSVPRLYADERRVQQILVNLLSNAIKFTPAAGRITVRAEVDGSGRVVLEVADTGIGIPAEKLDVVMSVFGQLERPAMTSREGAGLGLPLSKRLAALHGAELSIRSGPGFGTVVRVAFPKERTEMPAQQAQDPPTFLPAGECPE